MRALTLLATLVLAVSQAIAKEPPTKADDLLEQAAAAAADGKTDVAVGLASKAVELAPDGLQARLFRGKLYESQRRHEEAVADYTKAIELDPRRAEVYDRRGSELFKLGRIDDSIVDFDKFIELVPDQEPYHWKRGISYYYAGRYADGQKQFEGYQTVDDNDVENAVWRYLCMARDVGVAEAQKAILKIKNDRRVPMMQVYALFSGELTPGDVLAAARAGQPTEAELNERLFYAHLYLGLYHDAAGEREQALQHIRKAADDHKIGHYMWDVAKVHKDLLEKDG